MRKSAITIALFLAFLGPQLFGQDFTGLATYKTAMKMNIAMDSTEMSADQQSLMQQRLMKALQKEYELSFNAYESNWKEVGKLDKETASDGIQIVMVGAGGGEDGLLYKNTKEANFIETTDAFGKLFLVSGAMEKPEWKITDESKQIGQYTCYKATSEREVTETRMTEMNGEKVETEEKRMQTTTVWYTPDIPVAHGPDTYWGLPGLILEASNGNRVIICNKVVLNPKNKAVITIPSKGKKVTAEAYEEIMREQSQKMRKMYGGGKRKGQSGNSISISIDN
ncbi:GLPGLI family protein [Muriicola sp. Z0-33]|uniref:GLPGLI family protein n=1 Tax=Muriicola sp. Z0-33 TaxID=2816957 RepID=UPI00223730BE|nr:GLPGLI family protein [Muriicola sp. Z0-33]MCW5516110.1 GLPGLI family protein [Muriicola sp. Z0-33]